MSGAVGGARTRWRRVAVADGGSRGGGDGDGDDAEPYLDLDGVPVGRATSYVDVEGLLDRDADSYVDAERLVDPGRGDDGGRDPGAVGEEGREREREREPRTSLGTGSTFDPATGFEWVEGLSAEDDGSGDVDADPTAAFAAVTGFGTGGDEGGNGGGDDEVDATDTTDTTDTTDATDAAGAADEWSVAGSLDPEQVTRTRVGGGVEAGVDDGTALGESGDPPLDLDEFVPGEFAAGPAGLDPENVTRVESAAADEAVARLQVFGPRGRGRGREHGRGGDEDEDEGDRGRPS